MGHTQYPGMSLWAPPWKQITSNKQKNRSTLVQVLLRLHGHQQEQILERCPGASNNRLILRSMSLCGWSKRSAHFLMERTVK